MYGILLAGERVVALAQPRAHALHAHDLLLLTSFVLGSDSFRAAAESFSPICLPNFNPTAFLHAYVRFLDEVCLRLHAVSSLPCHPWRRPLLGLQMCKDEQMHGLIRGGIGTYFEGDLRTDACASRWHFA